ncbi:MAG: T9SS type A sorting domain-containing protein [Bacteroidales bacterium]|nr:T9SS type A sorting domain-containing protein [Bacteroidales bacterium]MCF8454283.1 T9SS type A sorting domain-containing protein [Bacteroidales bacterium]
MKKLFLFGLILIIFQLSSFGQAQTLKTDIYLHTQSQVNSFPTTYSNNPTIYANIYIGGVSVINLDSLISIKELFGSLSIKEANSLKNLSGLDSLSIIWEDLVIRYNDSLQNLTGLGNLDSIGGTLNITQNDTLISLTGMENLKKIGSYLSISNMPNLTSLQGLNSLSLVNGSIYIHSLQAITTLEGLNSLTSVCGGFSLNYNNALQNLSGLENLSYLDGDLKISSNAVLTSLSVLMNISYITGDLAILSNGSIANLSGLDNIDSIGGSLSIMGMGLLTNLDGLDSLKNIGGALYISNNFSLTDISAISNINPSSITNLGISDNTILSTCNVQNICDYLASPNGVVSIFKNAPGCKNPHEVANSCGLAMSCLPYGDYHFYSQNDVDSFTIYYPNCHNLKGNVYIRPNSIWNLDSLYTITSISKTLDIWSVPVWDWSGLNNLNSIGNDLVLYTCNSIHNCNNFQNLTSLGGTLLIYGCNNLSSLSGLQNIDPITLGGLRLIDNPELSYCQVQSICEYLGSSGAYVEIHDNASGCNSQVEIQTLCPSVSINDLYQQTEFSISPNPAGNHAILRFNSAYREKVSIEAYSASGVCHISKQFVSQNRGGQEIVLDLSKLTSGMYFVKLQTAKEVVVRKIVKQ